MAEVWIVDEQLHIYSRGHDQGIQYCDQLPEHAEEIVSRIFSGELVYSEAFSDFVGRSSMTAGAPVYREGTVIGAVLVHSPVSGIDDAVKQGMMALMIGCGAAMAAAGAVSAALAYHFTRPLYQMKAAASELAGGNYAAQTGVRSKDEIGQLAETMDMLAHHLEAAQKERENLDRMRDSFVANVSHELRTPVAVLRGYLELLKDGAVTEPAAVGEYYEQMLLESRHMERLVNDLLDLSRLQDIGFQLTMEEVDLCCVVSDAVRAIRRTAQSKSVTVVFDVPGFECIVTGDYGRIRQMLIILLDNAVKFSYENGQIEVVLTCEDGYVIRVTDHGTGIPKEQLPYIFERFHKSDAKENKNGSGLGLAIANEIAKRHQAVIHAESTESETTFRICFFHVESV